MKKIIVSLRVDSLQDRCEVRDSIDQSLVKFILLADLLPFLISNVLVESTFTSQSPTPLDLFLQKLNPDGFILSGGNDIEDISIRDHLELKMLDYASSYRLPVLGICRGMQLLAYREGVRFKKIENHIGTSHLIQGNISKVVNSYHEYQLESCPNNYHVIARSLDSNIEAIRHKYLPWEGWMWHPERNLDFCNLDLNRLVEIFE